MQLQKIIINKNAHKEIYGTINRTKWQQRDPCLGGVLSICEYARGVHVCMVGMWKRVFPWREFKWCWRRFWVVLGGINGLRMKF